MMWEFRKKKDNESHKLLTCLCWNETILSSTTLAQAQMQVQKLAFKKEVKDVTVFLTGTFKTTSSVKQTFP